MAYEPDIYAEWSQTILVADTALQTLPNSADPSHPLRCAICENVAPAGTPLPYLVRTLAGGPGYLYSEGLQVVWYEGVWYFTAYVAGNDAALLAAILDRVQVLLYRGSGATAAGRVLLTYQSRGAHSGPPDSTGGQLVTQATVEYTALVQAP